MPRAALWHWQAPRKCWRYFYRGRKCAPRRARRSSQTTRAAPTPPQSSCRCLGGHVRNRCSLFTLPHSHAIPGAACGRVCTVLAQDWHSVRRLFVPCELRMHPGDGYYLARMRTLRLTTRLLLRSSPVPQVNGPCKAFAPAAAGRNPPTFAPFAGRKVKIPNFLSALLN